MSHLVINGGKKLRGSIEVQSAKNSAVSILIATAMIRGKVRLTDVPQIEEVHRIVELLRSIGVSIEPHDGNGLAIDASKPLNLKDIDPEACRRTRSSLMLLGALSARAKRYKIFKSGGCKLGARSVRPHIYALNKLGVHAVSREGFYDVTNKPLRAADIVMYESGDTTTENAVMAAVLAPGTTTIKMASANYMVQDLCYFLVKAGARIEGIGTTTLTIHGVKKLKSVDTYPIMPDPIVAMTMLSIAITTRSPLTIRNCPLEFLELEVCKLEVMGQKLTLKNKRISKNGHFAVVDIVVTPSKLTALPDKIYGRPFPGLNIDNLPLFVPILATSEGRTLVHDWAFENRAVYSLELQKLGAKITLLDPHRIWVEGPTSFVPNEIIAPPALRPAVNVLIAMLAAPGTSILRNTYEIDRGYERLYETLNAVGADITFIQE